MFSFCSSDDLGVKIAIVHGAGRVAASMAEKLTPKPRRAFEGVADPAYLVSEIEQLRDIAREAGLGTLEYLLECAAIEARASSPQRTAGITMPQRGATTGRHPRAELCRPTAPLPSLAYS
jgi:hypothetical protein